MKTFSLIIGTKQKQNHHDLACGVYLLPGQALEEGYIYTFTCSKYVWNFFEENVTNLRR